MPKLLWFRQDRDETAILDTLAAMAAQHGYINQRGPKHGAGNVAELMAAIATGEVKLLLLPDGQRDRGRGPGQPTGPTSTQGETEP